MPFQINIAIDENGLNTITNANQSVTLVQSVVSAAETLAVAPPAVVAWLAFQPLENNQIVWSASYYLYATTTALQTNAVIEFNSQTAAAAQPGWIYTFTQGQFNGSAGTGSSYNLSNQTQGSAFGFGLAVSATVNGTTAFAPLNAAPVLYNEEAFFTPQDIVSIFLSSAGANGTVLPQLPANALNVTLSSQSPTADVGFNDATNLFYLLSGDSAR